MKVKIEGYDVEGSADEIVTLVKKLGEKTEPKPHIEKQRNLQPIKRPKVTRKTTIKRRTSIEETFPYAMELYKKGNISLRKSLIKAGIENICGEYYAKYKKFLIKNNVKIIKGIRPKKYNI